MINSRRIRALIKEKYDNDSNFADEIGIPKGKLSRILNHKVACPMEVAEEMIEKLDIEDKDIKPIFFASKVV